MGRKSIVVTLAAAVATSTALLAAPLGVNAQSRHAAATPHAARTLMLALLNAERARVGVRPLTLSLKQSRCSFNHSRAMAQAGYIYHGMPGDLCVSFTAAGENIGQWPRLPVDAVRAINTVMWNEGPCPIACAVNSAAWEAHGHYINITNRAYGKVGIGISYKNGVTWLTEDFTN